MRLSATHVPHPIPRPGEDADGGDLDELLEEMFPASFLPTFTPIPGRRARLSETRGLRTRRERTSRDH